MKRINPFLRFFNHLVSHTWQVHKRFSASALRNIEQAIKASERTHLGEIRFVVESGLHPIEIIYKKTPKKRALEVFGRFNVWDTQHNTGVLIYLLLADRDVEIVADRGIHQHVGNNGWDAICHAMELEFRQGSFESGVLQGLYEISQLLQTHFPAASVNDNELPNRPIIL